MTRPRPITSEPQDIDLDFPDIQFLSVFLNGLVKYLPPNQTNHISAESEKTLGDLAKKKKKNEGDANSGKEGKPDWTSQKR